MAESRAVRDPVRAGWRFWVDRGGTFTDVVATRPDGARVVAKLPSVSPGRYADATLPAIRALLATDPAPAPRIAEVRIGTTVATNALLERTGARTVLVTTAGLGDALAIGTQERPHLFRMHIERPAPLHTRVVEARERVSAEGTVLTPLEEGPLACALGLAREAGFTSVAIVFLHGWRYPLHEQRAAALARAAGFAHVSVSHEVAPLERYVPRGTTTVADAYLTPVLRAYTAGLVAGLTDLDPGVAVGFMQSHGGLASEAAFSGVPALLSGPAGGLVGMAGTARAMGYTRLVGFDMGGTSTDVSLYDGHYPRRYEAQLAGVRITAPMLDIHTVAAGGGSLLAYESGRYRVGPGSSGATPGPACYGQGGPLSVTDIHVLLGRLRPESFPAVFGADGASPLDAAASARGFAELAARISAARAAPVAVEALAEGFLEVAIETMANAIKEATFGAGHDAREFTLVCFGGAGGQHACRLAAALGIGTVLIHPLAGVLSALGLGHAAPRTVRRATLGVALDAAGLQRATARAGELARAARAELGDGTDAARVVVHADLRLASAEATVPVPLGTCAAMRSAFLAAFERRYGYRPDAQAALVLEALTVEAAHAERLPAREAPVATTGAARHVRAWFGGAYAEVPHLERAALAPGSNLLGPAILSEPTATTVLEPGWRATVATGGELVLTHEAPAAARAADPEHPDGALLEVFHALFRHAAEQMGTVLRQSASSVNIRERLDYSCALFDAAGHLVANAPHMPVHLGSMGASVRAVMARHTGAIEDGDAFLLNSPYAGGTHLPDLTVVSPVYAPGRSGPAFWVASRAHHADVGGSTPGSMPPFSRSIAEEGVLFTGERIVRAGRFDDAAVRTALAAGPYPCRSVERNLADLSAQLAANARGARELARLGARYGFDVVGAYMRHVQDNAAATVREAVRALARAGHTGGRATVTIDGGECVAVSVTLSAADGTAHVDFAGTSATSPRNFNAPLAVCTAAVLYVFRTLVAHDIPLNEGCLRPITLTVPPGSLLAPVPPAAVVAGNVETSQCIVDALYGALGVLAGAQGTMNNLTFGNATYQYYETIAGGSGAGAGFPGADGVQTHMTNSRLTDPEVLESRLPVLVREFRYRRDSGGRGRWRGGDGLVRVLEFRAPLEVAILSNHRERGGAGLAGGGDGAPGANLLLRADGAREPLGATDGARVAAGDRISIATPGGGGFGPADRC